MSSRASWESDLWRRFSHGKDKREEEEEEAIHLKRTLSPAIDLKRRRDTDYHRAEDEVLAATKSALFVSSLLGRERERDYGTTRVISGAPMDRARRRRRRKNLTVSSFHRRQSSATLVAGVSQS